MESIYVVFSATPYKMGRMIRTVLRAEYNHVSLSFDADLSTMYTFARFHEDTPLYGGFVSESPCRYLHAGRCAQLKVCRLEVEDEHYRRLREMVDDMERGSRRYLYNLYSAMFAPLHLRMMIRDSYTCAEFVGDALSVAGVEIPHGAFHSLKGMQRLLDPYTVYEGACTLYATPSDWGGDAFPEKMGRISGTKATLGAIGRLTARVVMGMYAAIICHIT